MIKLQLTVGIILSILGLGNLGFYGWGSHDPASLAVGIGCMFVATWFMLDKQD